MPETELPTPPPAPDQQVRPEDEWHDTSAEALNLPLGGKGTEDESGDVNERVSEAEQAAMQMDFGGKGLDGVELDNEGQPVQV